MGVKRVSDGVDGPAGWMVGCIGDALTHYRQYIYPGFPCGPFPGKLPNKYTTVAAGH